MYLHSLKCFEFSKLVFHNVKLIVLTPTNDVEFEIESELQEMSISFTNSKKIVTISKIDDETVLGYFHQILNESLPGSSHTKTDFSSPSIIRVYSHLKIFLSW